MSATGSAQCATHPDIAAVGTCSRCGDYFCRACDDPHHAGVCVRCGARLPTGLAWEDKRAGALPRRFVLSLRDLVIRPRVAFPGPARVGWSLAFAAIVGLLFGGALVAMAGALSLDAGSFVRLRLTETPSSFALAMLFAVLLPVAGAIALTAAQASSFAVGLVSVGRRYGVGKIAVRACAYAQAPLLACVALPFVLALLAQMFDGEPTLLALTRGAWIGMAMLWPVLSGRVCYWAGRGLGLTPARAAFACVGPTVSCVPLAAIVSHQQLELMGV